VLVNYHGILADSNELPLPADDNPVRALLLQNYWSYNRQRGSYSIWYDGGCCFAPNQRYALAMQQALARLEREEELNLVVDLPAAVEPSTPTSSEVIQ
jgi:hypothetical protein